jgi:hypothetical protein
MRRGDLGLEAFDGGVGLRASEFVSGLFGLMGCLFGVEECDQIGLAEVGVVGHLGYRNC